MHTDEASGEMTRGQRRKARTVQAILEAAERQFLERGYGAATLEAIAEDADVAVGSIYFHFAGKDDLYLAVTERAIEQLTAYEDNALAGATTPRARLIALGDAYLRFALDHSRTGWRRRRAPGAHRSAGEFPHHAADGHRAGGHRCWRAARHRCSAGGALHVGRVERRHRAAPLSRSPAPERRGDRRRHRRGPAPPHRRLRRAAGPAGGELTPLPAFNREGEHAGSNQL
jgi:AcrR family transcriptional regulator